MAHRVRIKPSYKPGTVLVVVNDEVWTHQLGSNGLADGDLDFHSIGRHTPTERQDFVHTLTPLHDEYSLDPDFAGNCLEIRLIVNFTVRSLPPISDFIMRDRTDQVVTTL